MAKLHIFFPPTPYTNERTNQRLIELGAPKELLKENESRAELIRESVVLGSRMTWGEVSETSITIVYKGSIPKGVEIALRHLRERGVITSWGKHMTGQEGRSMFDDLVATWEELGTLLADVQENHMDMHPSAVAEVLRNCGLKAMELTRDIEARRQYVIDEVLPDWTVTQSGADAGMPPARQSPVSGDGMDIS
jgi:hypothetical protein